MPWSATFKLDHCFPRFCVFVSLYEVLKVFAYWKNMVSQSTLDLISWKILLQTCCLKCLIRHHTIQWWAELGDSHRIRPYLNTDPVVKQLTHYIGLDDLNRTGSCFCSFSNLFGNSLSVQCIHDISNLLWIFDANTKKEKNNLETAWPPIDPA